MNKWYIENEMKFRKLFNVDKLVAHQQVVMNEESQEMHMFLGYQWLSMMMLVK